MKRILLSFILATATLISSAQNQEGYIKTKGRMDENGKLISGKRLAGVSVIVKGGNSTISHENGRFSLLIPGQRFSLQNVLKKGYVLMDPEVLQKEWFCSANDIIIVMQTPDEQMEDQLNASQKLMGVLMEQLNQKKKEIKKLKEDNKITTEEYIKLQKELLAANNDNERLINDMVEAYASIDYDQLDEFNRNVSLCILNGQFSKADSLLKTKGSIESRIKNHEIHKEANRKEREELNLRENQLQKSELYSIKETEEIAQDCYHYYATYHLRHQHDSAAYYLEMRAKLDTLNFDYVWECGSYFLNVRKYDKARHYLEQLAGNQSLSPVDMGMALNDLAICYSYMGLNALGIETIKKSLELRLRLAEEEPQKYNVSVALASSNYAGQLALYGNDSETAYKYFRQGMELYEDLIHHSHFFSVNLANVKENLANQLIRDSRHEEAVKYLLEAYDTRLAYAQNYPQYYYTDRNIPLPEISSMIGELDCESFMATRECRMIIRSAAENNKEQLAYAAKKLADIYFNVGDTEQCRHYLSESDRFIGDLFKSNHEKYLPALCSIYVDNCLFHLNSIGDTASAENMATDLLKILDNEDTDYLDFDKYYVYGEIYSIIGQSKYVNLQEGCIENYLKSLEYYNKCVILNDYDRAIRIQNVYRMLAYAYSRSNDIENSLLYFNKRIELLNGIEDTQETLIYLRCNANYDIGIGYLSNNDINRATEHLGIAAGIIENSPAFFQQSDCVRIYYYYGIALIHSTEYDKASESMKKALLHLKTMDDNANIHDMAKEIDKVITQLEELEKTQIEQR